MAKIGVLKPFRGTASQLANIVLENGEIAFETTHRCIYMGDGSNTMSNLYPFVNNRISRNISVLNYSEHFENLYPNNISIDPYSQITIFGDFCHLYIGFTVLSNNIAAWKQIFRINNLIYNGFAISTANSTKIYNNDNILMQRVCTAQDENSRVYLGTIDNLPPDHFYQCEITFPVIYSISNV